MNRNPIPRGIGLFSIFPGFEVFSIFLKNPLDKSFAQWYINTNLLSE